MASSPSSYPCRPQDPGQFIPHFLQTSSLSQIHSLRSTLVPLTLNPEASSGSYNSLLHTFEIHSDSSATLRFIRALTCSFTLEPRFIISLLRPSFIIGHEPSRPQSLHTHRQAHILISHTCSQLTPLSHAQRPSTQAETVCVLLIVSDHVHPEPRMWSLHVCTRLATSLLCKDRVNKYTDPSHGSLVLWRLHSGALLRAHPSRLARLTSSSERIE